MAKFYSIFFIYILAGCGYGIETKPVSLDTFLNDNSSKVWLVKHKFVNGEKVSAGRSGFREVFIFYHSTKVIVQPLNSLGNAPNFQGYYELSTDNSKINFEMPKENWYFKIDSYGEHQIVLIGNGGVRKNEKLILIPLPDEF